MPRVLLAAGGIYTAQSLVGSLTFSGVPAVLRAEKIALEQIGLVSLAMLVWALKFLWAAPVERWRIAAGGKRRSRVLIITGEVVVVLALVAFAMAGKADFSIVLGLLVIVAVVSATVDIVCDAFLIEQFTDNKRGLANVAQVGGGYLGMIFGSGLFVASYAAFGWTIASLLLAALVILFTIPMAMIREIPVIPSQSPTEPRLLNGLRRREVRIGIAMAITFELSGRLAQALDGPFLVDANLPLATLGLLKGAGGVAAGLVGTAFGGTLAHRIGSVNAMFSVACLHCVSLAALAGAIVFAPDQLSLLVGLFVLESTVMAAGFVTSYARLMALTAPSQPGVDFTLFQCASAIAAALCGMAGAMLASRVGYAPIFALAALLAILVPPLLFLFEHRLKRGILT
nr:MFS transporter [Ochrobactrum sp. BTU2]